MDLTYLFDEIFWGTYHVSSDDSGYIYMKLPIGKHHLANASNGKRTINFPDNFITFDIPESKIYYIGDIELTMDLNMRLGSFFGVTGVILDATKKGEPPPIKLKDNYEVAKHYFDSLFNNKETILKSIIKINNE